LEWRIALAGDDEVRHGPPFVAQAILASLPVVLTVGLGFAANYVQSERQHAAEQQRQSAEFASSLERQRRQTEADLLLEVIKVGDLAVATANIDFLLRAGLVRDPDGRIAAAAKAQPPVLPTAAGTLNEVAIPAPSTEQGKLLVDRIADDVAKARPSRLDRRGPLATLVGAISSERGKYSLRELAIVLALIEHETSNSFTPAEERCSYRALESMPHTRELIPADPKQQTEERCFSILYGGRLGNRTGTDDAYRYRGRGYVQIVGRYNYKRITEAWKTDYVSQPELLLQPIHAFRATLTMTDGPLKRVRVRPDFAAPLDAFNYAAALRMLTGGSHGMATIAPRARDLEALLMSAIPAPPTATK
jgi:predicted chitinase